MSTNNTTAATTAAKKAAPPIKPLPADVLTILQQQSERLTQPQMAEALNISTAYVNQALQDKFRGNVDRFAARVRGLWGGSTVACPVLGSINTKVCLDQQAKAKSAAYTNPMRVAVARACKTCPNRDKGDKHVEPAH